MKLIMRVLLWPFSVLYSLIMRLRNHLYDIGYNKSFSFQTRLISVGNLSLGGNGKTPMVEYLIRLLARHYKTAILSRGYGRSTKGFILAESEHSAETIGDEPNQIFLKFHKDVKVAVGESRALAIPSILLEHPETELILLDDAFQHRSVVPDLNILVTDYWQPFYSDYVVPVGRLRESRSGVRRADLVVVTKCPDNLSGEEQESIGKKIRKYHDVPVYFSVIAYQKPIHFYSDSEVNIGARVLLLTSIAKTSHLLAYIESQFKLVDHLAFRDHFRFQQKHVRQLVERYRQLENNCDLIVTTEKDMVKLIPYRAELQNIPIYYIPISFKFIENGPQFDSTVLNKLQSIK